MGFDHRRARILSVGSAIIAGALLLTGCTDPEPPEPEEIADPLPDDVVEQLQAAAERGMAASGAPGAIVGVWVPWSGEWTAGLGETEPGSGEAPSTDMSFRTAQITRSMTCDVLYAMDGGAVSIDDSITQHVASVPQLEEVTLEDLCDGTAGLPSSEARNWNFMLNNSERVWDPREYAAAGLGEGRGDTGVWSGSDTSFFLLGLALEAASNQSLAELYETYVAEPTGLSNTFLPGDAAATAGQNALPGFYSGSRMREEGCVEAPNDMSELSASIGYANSGVVSTVDDLGTYIARLAADAGSSDALEARWAETLPVEPDGEQWKRAGGGDRLYGSMIGQQGAIFGYSTAAYSDVDTGLTVVVSLNNSAGGGDLAGALARELAAIALDTPGDSRPEASLPWTASQAHESVAAAAACPIE